jgi:homospermidine synthase
MSEQAVHTHFPGRLIFIGFGSIGQGVLPLILRHLGGLTADRITIVTADDAGREEAAKYGIKFLNHPLTRELQAFRPADRPRRFRC